MYKNRKCRPDTVSGSPSFLWSSERIVYYYYIKFENEDKLLHSKVNFEHF